MEVELRNTMHEKVFIDCGANRGQSIIHALEKWPDIYVISFEPVMYLYEKLYEVWKTHPQVQLFNYAVWTSYEKKDINISDDYTDASSLFEEKIDRNFSHKEDCMTIDFPDFFSKNILNKFNTIILKLDIEGAEYDILYSMAERDLLKFVDILYCEFHGEKFDKQYYRENLEKKMIYILSYLKQNNMKWYKWDADNILEENKKYLIYPDNIIHFKSNDDVKNIEL